MRGTENSVSRLTTRQNPMGAEPWLSYISSTDYTPASIPIVEADRLIAQCQAEAIPCERLYGQREIFLTSTNKT